MQLRATMAKAHIDLQSVFGEPQKLKAFAPPCRHVQTEFGCVRRSMHFLLLVVNSFPSERDGSRRWEQEKHATKNSLRNDNTLRKTARAG